MAGEITVGEALEYYKKFSDKLIDRDSLAKLFADHIKCQPSDINLSALNTKLNRLKHKDKLVRGKPRLKFRSQSFQVPLGGSASASPPVTQEVADKSEPAQLIATQRQLTKEIAAKTSLSKRLQISHETVRKNYELAKQAKRKYDRLKKKKESTARIVAETKDLKRELKKLRSSLEVRDKKIVSLNRKLQAQVRLQDQVKLLEKEKKEISRELCEKTKLVETYEPLHKALTDHNVELLRENSELKETNINLQENLHYFDTMLEEKRTVQLFNKDTNSFTNSTVECIMNLDNLNIANNKIPSAIKEVLKLVNKVPDRLPSRRTVDSLVRAKGVVARTQLAEVLPEKVNTTLYTDETRKFGKVYNVYIATDTDKDCYMLGLREMSNKSARTCLDTFKEILEDISAMKENSVAGDLIVTNIKNTMSDRAQTEVAFNNLLLEYRDEILPTICNQWEDLNEEEQTNMSKLNNFFCGLHLLVSFAEVCSTALTKFETTFDDANVQESEESKSESSTIRCIRTASKCLSRGGDEKSGCYQEFLTYCKTINEKVRFVRFHGNRFNLIFFLAQVTYYHQENVIKFFEEVHGTTNKLHSSVLTDIKKPLVMAGCKVLGLLSKVLSAPLWRVLEETKHVLDMNHYYEQVISFLERTCEDSSAFLMGEDSPFPDELVERDEVFTRLSMDSSQEVEAITGPITHALCTALLQLLSRMVKDHLPGGRYQDVNPQEREKMTSVIPHNKLPEFVFGQLDFLVRYRPNASALVNESFLMYAMNKTEQWLDGLDPQRKEELLSSVRKKERSYSDKFRDRCQLIAEDRKRRMREKEDALRAKRIKLAQQREDLTSDIIYYGLWQSIHQMESALIEIDDDTECMEAIKKQLQFRKTVLEQVADKTLFQVGSKGGGPKYKKFTLDELKRNLSTLITMSLRGPTLEEEIQGKPLLVGKHVRHTFEEGVWKGYVIGTVPGYPAWYNIYYGRNKKVYSYKLQDDYAEGDLEILFGPASRKFVVQVEMSMATLRRIGNQSTGRLLGPIIINTDDCLLQSFRG